MSNYRIDFVIDIGFKIKWTSILLIIINLLK